MVRLNLIAYAVTEHQGLTGLYLRNCSVDNNGAGAIAKALNRNTALTTLDFSSNPFDDVGAMPLARAFLTSISTLKCLDLRYNTFLRPCIFAIRRDARANAADMRLVRSDSRPSLLSVRKQRRLPRTWRAIPQ
jgi:Leucine Rich repeat